MVNSKDPFKYKVDSIVKHSVHGDGKVCTLHSVIAKNEDGKIEFKRFYWVRFLNGEIMTECLEQDLTLIKE